MSRPKSPDPVDAHSAEHRLILAKLFGGVKGIQPLVLAGANVSVDIDPVNGTYTIHAQPRGGGGGDGIKWQSPRELDPTVAVPVDTLVYISPENPICTVGLTDYTLGPNTKATAGLWLALQAIPAKSGSSYNVPQDPIPTNGGAVTGTPLTGDVDNTGAYWLLIKPVC